MIRHILYAYICGSDNRDIAHDVLLACDGFIAARKWTCKTPHTVNQRRPDDPSLRQGDLPDWDLGLNMTLPDPGNEMPGWYSDVAAIAEFLAKLTTVFTRDFVIGIYDTQSKISQDLHYIRSEDPELQRLRTIIGVGSIE